jgi:hypothetical protein
LLDDVDTRHDCCFQAWQKQISWDIMINHARSAVWQDAQCQAMSAAGEWAGPSYVPMAPWEFLVGAAHRMAQEDDAWDHAMVEARVMAEEALCWD